MTGSPVSGPQHKAPVDKGAPAEERDERINSMPKFVASTSQQGSLSWNAGLLDGGLPESVGSLKQRMAGRLLERVR
jgi:hypothetical protein